MKKNIANKNQIGQLMRYLNIHHKIINKKSLSKPKIQKYFIIYNYFWLEFNDFQ